MRSFVRRIPLSLVAMTLLACATPLATGQTPAAKKEAAGLAAPAAVAPAVMVAAAKAADDEKGPLPREDVSFRTSDGLLLQAGFYPSRAGKNAVPVILIHMYRGAASDYDTLARALQEAGHAVIVPDLRGHGRSTVQELGDRKRIIEPQLLKRRDFELMVTSDMEAVKRFLVDKNNAGELNIEKLCVVGAEMGATVAMNWAAWDWHWPPLSTGKQGQDVKALVLISPPWSFKGVTLGAALSDENMLRNVSFLLAYGASDPTVAGEAKRLQKSLDRFHPLPPPEQAKEHQTFFVAPEPTSLQGTKILGEKSLRLLPNILQFIDLRLSQKTFPWAVRSRVGG